MIKAVIFDLDGTLLNRDESVKKFVDNEFERLNKWVNHIPKDKYLSRFIELDNRGYVWKDKVYQQLTEELDITGITWEDFLQDYKREFKNNCIPFPNLFEMLEELRNNNLTLEMITNGIGQFQMDNIMALGIEKYFQTFLVSESVYVGDHPENDVKAAQNI